MPLTCPSQTTLDAALDLCATDVDLWPAPGPAFPKCKGHAVKPIYCHPHYPMPAATADTSGASLQADHVSFCWREVGTRKRHTEAYRHSLEWRLSRTQPSGYRRLAIFELTAHTWLCGERCTCEPATDRIPSYDSFYDDEILEGRAWWLEEVLTVTTPPACSPTDLAADRLGLLDPACVVELLHGEGLDDGDVLAAVSTLIDAGLTYRTHLSLISPSEVGLIREQVARGRCDDCGMPLDVCDCDDLYDIPDAQLAELREAETS